jgi:hypothetical protein
MSLSDSLSHFEFANGGSDSADDLVQFSNRRITERIMQMIDRCDDTAQTTSKPINSPSSTAKKTSGTGSDANKFDQFGNVHISIPLA